jgi:hypothetical protein
VYIYIYIYACVCVRVCIVSIYIYDTYIFNIVLGPEKNLRSSERTWSGGFTSALVCTAHFKALIYIEATDSTMFAAAIA